MTNQVKLRMCTSNQERPIQDFAYALALGNRTLEKSKHMTKRQLVSQIMGMLPEWTTQLTQEYEESLPAGKKEALELYRGLYFQYINTYMRTGEIVLPDPFFSGVQMPSVPKVALSSKEKFVKHVCSKVASEIKKAVKELDLTKLPRQIKDLKEVIRNAPQPPSDFWCFRGERVAVSPVAPHTVTGLTYKLSLLKLKKGSTFHLASFTSFSFSPTTAMGFMSPDDCCLYRLHWDPKTSPPCFVMNTNAPDCEYEVLFPPCKLTVVRIWFIQSDLAKQLRVKVLDVKLS